MSKAEFLGEVRRARAAYEAALAAIPSAAMEEPGVAGAWSVKDVVAHVTWSEREMVGVLRSGVFSGSELWLVGEDERNARIWEQNRARPLADVLAERGTVYAELLRLIEGLPESSLNDPAAFREMPPDWIPWTVLRGNTYRHYRDHAAGLAAWWQERQHRQGDAR